MIFRYTNKTYYLGTLLGYFSTFNGHKIALYIELINNSEQLELVWKYTVLLIFFWNLKTCQHENIQNRIVKVNKLSRNYKSFKYYWLKKTGTVVQITVFQKYKLRLQIQKLHVYQRYPLCLMLSSPGSFGENIHAHANTGFSYKWDG